MENKLCLGTVQFGLKYGIKNEIKRQPTNEESFSVLKMAIDSDVTCFDTASVYGNAEDVLGEFGIGKHDVKVVSKLQPGTESIDAVEKQVRLSLKRLHMNKLDGYLLHDANDFYKKSVMKGLQLCKDKGLVEHIGVSIYEPENAIDVVKSRMIDYIQIPYNVFDQRLNKTNFFEIVETNDIKVFARSAFLQGLLLMDSDKIPSNLIIAKPWLEKFNEIIHAYDYSRTEAAFLFSYCHKGISKVVFGVDTKAQLDRNLMIIRKKHDFRQCYNALLGAFSGIDHKVLSPSLWN